MKDLLSWSEGLAEDELRSSLPRRWAHVRGVRDRALSVASLFGDSADVLVAAALLHDVGYAPHLVVTAFHPLDGARYLRGQGMEERVCALVAHHSCARVEAELRGLSHELAEWPDEASPLRDALWWADMTTTPDGDPTNVHDRIEEIKKRYGPEEVVTAFIRQAEQELVAVVTRTEERLRAAGLGHLAK